MDDISRPLEFGKELYAEKTSIPGLLIFDIPVHGDNRGWFKENWQRQKKVDVGLPDFGPIQNNISYNLKRGTTRGIHAEPWDKFISIAKGKVFVAIVDLRDGDTFGRLETMVLDPSKAIFVPRGCGNSFQTLEDDTVYTYLVNDHWYPNAEYTFLNLADPTVNIQWPIDLDEAELSDKDRQHPFFNEVRPMSKRKILVTGANGQLGKALRHEFPDAEYVTHDEFDITDESITTSGNWRQYEAIINTASYTHVDQAETPEGRTAAWTINATGVRHLSRIASENNVTLIHISSDYVFDGSLHPHTEDEPFSPLNVYGQSKAAGDVAAATAPRHYILRTSWAVGDGRNFVDTMSHLAANNINPKVVNDQFGRLTFMEDLAKAIKHLLTNNKPFGTYNFTNSGDVVSWADIARIVYKNLGYDEERIEPVTTEEYYEDRENVLAKRPMHSDFQLDKIESTGFELRNWKDALKEHLDKKVTIGDLGNE